MRAIRGNRYLAHKTADLTWNCAVTVKAREIWAEWRATVFGNAHLVHQTQRLSDDFFSRINCDCRPLVRMESSEGSPNGRKQASGGTSPDCA